MDPKKLDGVAACVYLATGKNEWLAVVNTIMNLMVPLNAGNSLTK